MNRKQFVKLASLGTATAATGTIAGTANRILANPVTAKGAMASKAVYVPNGKNRYEEELMIWGLIPLQIKVSGKGTNGSFFLFEHANMSKGGPPRHFHYEQDEWFYALKGEFAFEVDDEKFRLRPGDSLFAPRMIPHAWAYMSETPGTFAAGCSTRRFT